MCAALAARALPAALLFSLGMPCDDARASEDGVFVVWLGGSRARMTVSSREVTFRKRRLFSSVTTSYRFSDMTTLQLNRAFLRRPRVLIELQGQGRELSFRTKRRAVGDLEALLRSKM